MTGRTEYLDLAAALCRAARARTARPGQRAGVLPGPRAGAGRRRGLGTRSASSTCSPAWSTSRWRPRTRSCCGAAERLWDDRPTTQDLRHRRPRLPPPRRGPRRRLRAAARPGLRGDLRGDRGLPVELAAAAGHRRGPLRRGDGDARSTTRSPDALGRRAAFFYSNPLQLRHRSRPAREDAPAGRRPWYTCACCPPNLARLLAGVHGYLFTRTGDGIQIHHPATSRAQLSVAGGPVRLDLTRTTRTTGCWTSRWRAPATRRGSWPCGCPAGASGPG